MSNFINTSETIQSTPVINNKLRKVSFNPYAFRSSALTPLRPEHQERQQRYLKNICNRINLEERDKIRALAHEQAQQQLNQLKGKMRRNITKENVKEIMSDKKEVYHSLLDKVMHTPSETVALDKKYHKKINMKLGLLNQAESINSEKMAYRCWYDSVRNRTTNSPIYNKINYLLEKLSNELPRGQFNRQTIDSEILIPRHEEGYHKKIRKYTQDSRQKIKNR